MWFSVRHVIRNGSSYEERMTLWEAESFAEAITLAEAEAAGYAAETLHDGQVLDLFQAYHLPDPPSHGSEAFSLIHESALEPREYIASFFDTGAKLQVTSQLVATGSQAPAGV